MKRLLFAVFLFAAVQGYAADTLQANWGQGNITNPPAREVTDNSNVNKPLAIVGAGSLDGSVSNASMTVNGKNISINDSAAAAEATSGSRDTQGAYVAGGAVLNSTVSDSKLNLNNLTLQGRDAYGGSAVLRDRSLRMENGSANGNSAVLNNVTTQTFTFTSDDGSETTIGGNVYGGYAEYSHGTANNNSVSITGSTINGNVYGGRIRSFITPEDKKEIEGSSDSYANDNSVYIKDSTVNGTVAGSAGADNSNGNTVLLENSTVNNVYGVDQTGGIEDGDTSVTYANNNTVIIKGGEVKRNAAAVSTTSVNASNNTLSIEGATLNADSIYAVNMGLNTAAESGNPVKATVDKNTLSLSSLTGANFTEAGASINLVGTANNNTVSIKDSTLTLTNSAKLFFNKTLDAAALESHDLLSLPTDNNKGILFGGAAMTYTSQTNTLATAGEEAPEAKIVAVEGTNSDHNTIVLSNSTVNANVMGGFAAYINEQDYYTKTTEGEGADSTTTIEHVYKQGLTIHTETTPAPEQPTEDTDVEQIDDVYSASNNTVVLDNVNFSGYVYGGYVDGAELKNKNKLTQNNTVILRRDITLSDDSVIYGGSNNEYGRDTNTLVFDRTRGTFASKDQFQNFNNTWKFNADYDTDVKFNFEGVYGTMTVDPSAMKEGQSVVVTTQTKSDLTNIQQGEKVVDLTDNGISLVNNKLGIYSFDLSGIKQGANTVGWQLTGTKETTNLEVYGQLPFVGLALAMEGQEMLGAAITDAWNNENEANSFLNGAYHHTRYKTGSGFDLDSGIFQAGAWKKFTADWLGGFFVKYANGSYETFPIDVDGEADVFAGGLLTSLRYSETGRFEVDAEVGYMDMDFNSSELSSDFKSKGMYYGLGAGFVENLVENFDLFANFRFLRKEKDDITDNLGQKVMFDAMQSLALRFGAEYTFNQLDLYGLKPALGAMGIYEMDGKSMVKSGGLKTDEASLKGMSGRAQLSLVYENKDLFLPLRTALTVYGLVGKREGFGGEVNVAFSF